MPAKQDGLVRQYGTGASMSVRAVASQLWNGSPKGCCGRMLTSSLVLGQMPIQGGPKFSVVAQNDSSQQFYSWTVIPFGTSICTCEPSSLTWG